ncbi:MAG: hypothetical protein ACQESR_29825 [Planctomycetota bacterium]
MALKASPTTKHVSIHFAVRDGLADSVSQLVHHTGFVIFQAVAFFWVESCPTQAVLPLVGLAADKVATTGIFQAAPFLWVESCPTQAVLPLVGLAADKVATTGILLPNWHRTVLFR